MNATNSQKGEDRGLAAYVPCTMNPHHKAIMSRDVANDFSLFTLPGMVTTDQNNFVKPWMA